MKKRIKEFLKRTTVGRLLLNAIVTTKSNLLYLIPNEVFLKMKFKQMQGFPLDLKNPKTLNAKMQWLKLNDLTDLHKQCADKYTVRSFVEKEVGKEYLVPLLYITDNPKNLTYGN